MDPATITALLTLTVTALKMVKDIVDLLARVSAGEEITAEEVEAKQAETQTLLARLEAAVAAGRTPAESAEGSGGE